MAKPRKTLDKSAPDDKPDLFAYNPDDELMEGETADEWMSRQDEHEGRKHDAHESRTPPKWLEQYDPNMGEL